MHIKFYTKDRYICSLSVLKPNGDDLLVLERSEPGQPAYPLPVWAKRWLLDGRWTPGRVRVGSLGLHYLCCTSTLYSDSPTWKGGEARVFKRERAQVAAAAGPADPSQGSMLRFSVLHEGTPGWDDALMQQAATFGWRFQQPYTGDLQGKITWTGGTEDGPYKVTFGDGESEEYEGWQRYDHLVAPHEATCTSSSSEEAKAAAAAQQQVDSLQQQLQQERQQAEQAQAQLQAAEEDAVAGVMEAMLSAAEKEELQARAAEIERKLAAADAEAKQTLRQVVATAELATALAAMSAANAATAAAQQQLQQAQQQVDSLQQQPQQEQQQLQQEQQQAADARRWAEELYQLTNSLQLGYAAELQKLRQAAQQLQSQGRAPLQPSGYAMPPQPQLQLQLNERLVQLARLLQQQAQQQHAQAGQPGLLHDSSRGSCQLAGGRLKVGVQPLPYHPGCSGAASLVWLWGWGVGWGAQQAASPNLLISFLLRLSSQSLLVLDQCRAFRSCNTFL
ncbi:hypothetical protein ABPG75_011583 [Micractinium tetrahymenae]